MPIDDLQLRLALKAKDDGVARLAIFRDGGMKLRQLLKTGQFVQYKPYPALIGRGRANSK